MSLFGFHLPELTRLFLTIPLAPFHRATSERRVIVKAEVLEKGKNPRFVVTNLEGDAQEIYERIYCARGEMENRIKEQQLGLFSFPSA